MSGFGFYYAVNNDTSLTFTDERKRDLVLALEPEFEATNNTSVARHKEFVLDGDKFLKTLHPCWYTNEAFTDVPISLTGLNSRQRSAFRKVVYTLLADPNTRIKRCEITNYYGHCECLIVSDDGLLTRVHKVYIDNSGIVYGDLF